MENQFKAFFQQSKYLFKIFFFFPNTYLKRVVFGKDPIWKAFFYQSWGRLPQGLLNLINSRESLWINTESGGEVTQIYSLCKMLKEHLPQYNLLLSTHKYEAYLLAQKIDGVDYVFFSPWDITWVVRKVLREIRPKILMSIEIVTAPILFKEANRRGIKTFLCSGFMSKNIEKNRILKRAMPLGFYKYFDYVAAKEEIDKQGFEKICYPTTSIRVLGNLKYDAVMHRSSERTKEQTLNELGLKSTDKVLIGGSTHPGEDKFLIDAFVFLAEKDTQFRLVIAPRFFEFIDQLQRYLRLKDIPFIKKTAIKAGMDTDSKVIIIDTFGELAYLYSIASYAFIGSSIFPADPLGGHNIIEPMVYEIPIFHGPHMFKAKELVAEIKGVWEGFEINSSEELAKNIMILEENKVLKEEVQEKQREIICRNADSAERHVMFIKEVISAQEGK